jgi:CO/xanthine dehydrogenase FAD-binding subunit
VKPPPFAYEAPASVEEALELLDDDAKVLAGGQSLVPLLTFRLARPARIVDVNGLGELAHLRRSGGVLRIGALCRQVTVERSGLVAARWPLLRQAVVHVGHRQIRTRGTVGGSVAHADPSAELPVALCALDARFHVRSLRGARTLTSAELVAGPLMTTLAADELLVEIEVPPLPDGARTAFAEHARTHGDFATAGAAVVLAPGHAAVALLGTGGGPMRAREAEAALAQGAAAAEAAELAVAALPHGHRRAMVREQVRRAIEAATA